MSSFRSIIRITAFASLLYALNGNGALKVTPRASDLQFTELATVWDEAMPLGNATLGTLVWQRGDKGCERFLQSVD